MKCGLLWKLFINLLICPMLAVKVERSLRLFIRVNRRLQVKGVYPQQGEVVLNCDGAVTNAACSGVIRDHMGAYLCGFGAYIGSASVLKAELMAILFGFKLAWSRGFRKIRVESDSLNAIRLIPGQGSNLRPCYDII